MKNRSMTPQKKVTIPTEIPRVRRAKQLPRNQNKKEFDPSVGNKPKKTKELTDQEEIVSTVEKLDNKALLKLGYKLEERSIQLQEYLKDKNFNIVGELVDLYLLGELTHKEKATLLLNLLPYLYPKLRQVDTTEQNIATQNVIQVIYTDQQIRTEETGSLDEDDNNINNL